MFLEELNKHPRDSYIRFDKEPHKYYVHNKEMNSSVTTVVHSKFPKFDSNAIAKNLTRKHFNNEKSEYFQMTEYDILQKWEINKNNACSLGTELHESIELFYNNIKHYNTSKEYGYFENFCNDFKHLIPFRTEWEVYFEEASLAGSIDMIFKNEDGSLSIYDWKRSKKIEKSNQFEFGYNPVDHLPHSNFWHYSLQLNIYKYILEKKYSSIVKEMCLVILHPNNTNYIRLECPNLQNEVHEIITSLLR